MTSAKPVTRIGAERLKKARKNDFLDEEWQVPVVVSRPAVMFRGVLQVCWTPRRLVPFDLTLQGGVCHVLVGQADSARGLALVAAGLQPAEGGTFTIGGRPPSQAIVTSWLGAEPPRRRWWQRFLPPSPRPSALEGLVQTLAQPAELCVIFDPLDEVAPEDRPRVVEMVSAATRAGTTVLATTRRVEDALELADVVHLFERDGDLRTSGDVDAVFRPGADGPLAGDALLNPVFAPSFSVDFRGVSVALQPHGHDLSVSSAGPAGRGGFVAWNRTASFHVPARCIVLNPPFAHGDASGSPPRPLVKDVPVPPDRVDTPYEPRDDIDRSARLVVLEGVVTGVRPLGKWQRFEVLAEGRWRFHVDAPAGSPTPGQVRIGFDTAHIRSL